LRGSCLYPESALAEDRHTCPELDPDLYPDLDPDLDSDPAPGGVPLRHPDI
jgi:hypothetical protein